MYRRYLDRLRVDLIRIGADDISPSHAMLLFTIGDDDLSVRDLMDRGHYLGSNASYSLKQLVQSGYVDRTASARDRRSARIRLTDKGRRLCMAIKAADEVNQAQIVRNERDRMALEETFALLRKLEVIWATDLQQGNGRLGRERFLTRVTLHAYCFRAPARSRAIRTCCPPPDSGRMDRNPGVRKRRPARSGASGASLR